jgi:hypothetical protein
MTQDADKPDERIAHPNRGTLGQPPMGGGDHLYLSAQQLHDHEDEPSWRPPRQGLGTGSWIAIVIAAGVAVLVLLWAVGVI